MPKASIIIATLMESTPPVVERLRDKSFDLDDIEILVERKGTLSTARNAGISRAESDNLIFLDDDSLPQSGYISNTLDALEDHAAIRGKIISHESSYRSPGHYDLGETRKPCTYLQGCNMAVRREVVEKVGLFEPRLPYGHEEREWSDRINEHFSIYYIPNMTVIHPYATSFSDEMMKHYRHGREFVAYKHEVQGESIPRTIYHVGHPPNFTGSARSICVEFCKVLGLSIGLLQLGINGYRRERDPLPDDLRT